MFFFFGGGGVFGGPYARAHLPHDAATLAAPGYGPENGGFGGGDDRQAGGNGHSEGSEKIRRIFAGTRVPQGLGCDDFARARRGVEEPFKRTHKADPFRGPCIPVVRSGHRQGTEAKGRDCGKGMGEAAAMIF